MSNTCPNPECGAGSDAFLENDGQMVCMDCGTVVGGIISYEADYEPAGSSSNVSSHARQTLSGGSLDYAPNRTPIASSCRAARGPMPLHSRPTPYCFPLRIAKTLAWPACFAWSRACLIQTR